jgi:POT family proton-dependent oligopeptide transporter
MGIKLVSAVSAIAYDYLVETYDLNDGSGLASLEMLIGLVAFIFGQAKFNGVAKAPSEQSLKQSFLGFIKLEMTIYLGLLLSVFVVWQLVQNHAAVGALLGTTSVVALTGVIWFCLQKTGKVERPQMFEPSV